MNETTSFDPSDRLDSVLSILSHRYSRAVCCYFRTHSAEVVSVDTLAQFIVETDSREISQSTAKTLLHHTTLPKLEDAGFIEYDARSETVRYQPPETIEVLVDHILKMPNTLS